jgi:hypothetical protein
LVISLVVKNGSKILLNFQRHSWSGIRDADYNKASCLGLDMHARIVFVEENILSFD